MVVIGDICGSTTTYSMLLRIYVLYLEHARWAAVLPHDILGIKKTLDLLWLEPSCILLRMISSSSGSTGAYFDSP